PLVLGSLAGCDEPPAEPAAPSPGRVHRFGVLRDLVLYPQRGGHGGPFFLDRFETTNLDWHAYVTARHLLPTRAVRRGWDGQWSPPDALLARPVCGIDLRQARAYARWRLC